MATPLNKNQIDGLKELYSEIYRAEKKLTKTNLTDIFSLIAIDQGINKRIKQVSLTTLRSLLYDLSQDYNCIWGGFQFIADYEDELFPVKNTTRKMSTEMSVTIYKLEKIYEKEYEEGLPSFNIPDSDKNFIGYVDKKFAEKMKSHLVKLHEIYKIMEDERRPPSVARAEIELVTHLMKKVCQTWHTTGNINSIINGLEEGLESQVIAQDIEKASSFLRTFLASKAFTIEERDSRPFQIKDNIEPKTDTPQVIKIEYFSKPILRDDNRKKILGKRSELRNIIFPDTRKTPQEEIPTERISNDILSHEEKIDMKNIFISYSQKDSEFVYSLKEALEKNDVGITIDIKALKIGDDIEKFIGKSVKETDATIAVVSKNSLLSPWVAQESFLTMMNEEVTEKKKFLPISIDTFFKEDSAQGEVVKKISEYIKRIEIEIKKLIEYEQNIDNLSSKRGRLLEAKHNIGKILLRLNKVVVGDFSNGLTSNNLSNLVKLLSTDI